MGFSAGAVLGSGPLHRPQPLRILALGVGLRSSSTGNYTMSMQLVLAALMMVCAPLAMAAAEPATKNPESGKSSKLLRHVVLFKFKADVTPKQIDEVVDAFKALPGKIKSIADFEWGTDVSTENRAQGYTHCFLLSFRDKQGRDDYLPHPDHKKFGALVGPRLEGVLVVDYWTEK